MDEHNTELYNANSEFYVLPQKKPKEPWNCKRGLYSLVSISSAIAIGLLVGCFFAPWFFNTGSLSTTGTTLIGAYYSIFAVFAPFVLFCSCLHGCIKFNRKLYSERKTNRFTATDVLYAIQAICISFLKTMLIYYLIAIFSSPIVLIVVVMIAANSVFKIFKW